MKIKIIGSGEAFDSDGYGNNASVLFGKGVPPILFDCGYQIPERLWAYPKIYKNLEAIYFTHMHADHTFGVVPLLTRFKEEGRKKPLRIFGPQGIRDYIHRLLNLGYPGTVHSLPFKLDFKELVNRDVFKFKNLKFQCARSIHPVINLSVRVENSKGKSFAISGDGSMTGDNKKLYKGVDLLLQETFWFKSKGPFHCDLESLRKYVEKNQVKKVAIMHVSREFRKRMNRVVQNLQKKDKRYFIGKPGMTLNV